MARKATMQDVADALGISRVTVWKVFNNKGGVSEPLWQQITEKAKELGYAHQTATRVLRTPALLKQQPLEGVTISVIVSRPESSLFWTGIIHRIAKELAKRSINLLYTYVPSSYNEGYRLPELLSSGTVQGAIIINVYDEKMLRLVNELTIPKVFLDTVTAVPTYELTGDVLLLEGRNTIYQITDSIIKKGRRNIGFIGDVSYARTNRDRYQGFLDALQDNGIPVKSENCLLGPFGIYHYDDQISDFLDSFKKMPEAFVCASDYVAHFTYRHLAARGLEMPKDVALSGYDGTREYDNVAGLLTTVSVQTALLGKRLTQTLLTRIETPELPYELIYINPQIVFGVSTEF